MKHLQRFSLQPLLDKGFLEFEMCSVLLEGLKLALRRWCRPFICCCFRRWGRVHETSRTKGDSKQKGEAKKTLDSCTYSISPADFSKVSVCNDLKICLRVDSGQNRVEKTSLVKISITISIAWSWMFCGYIQALHLHGSVLYKASGLKHNTGQPRRVNYKRHGCDVGKAAPLQCHGLINTDVFPLWCGEWRGANIQFVLREGRFNRHATAGIKNWAAGGDDGLCLWDPTKFSKLAKLFAHKSQMLSPQVSL